MLSTRKQCHSTDQGGEDGPGGGSLEIKMTLNGHLEIV